MRVELNAVALGGRQIVNVLSLDPDLGQGLDEGSRGRAQGRASARMVVVGRGDWYPPEDAPDEDGLLGLLVFRGFVARRVLLGGRSSVELLGPGDVIRPFEGETDELAMVPSRVSWQVLERLELAVLDERFYEGMVGFPEVLAQLLDRVARRARLQTQQLAAMQHKLTAAIHWLLWMLADRYGRVETDGVALPIPLSHRLLAEMLGAKRPSVTGAMRELQTHGLVRRRAEGGWWLGGIPYEELTVVRPGRADRTSDLAKRRERANR